MSLTCENDWSNYSHVCRSTGYEVTCHRGPSCTVAARLCGCCARGLRGAKLHECIIHRLFLFYGTDVMEALRRPIDICSASTLQRIDFAPSWGYRQASWCDLRPFCNFSVFTRAMLLYFLHSSCGSGPYVHITLRVTERQPQGLRQVAARRRPDSRLVGVGSQRADGRCLRQEQVNMQEPRLLGHGFTDASQGVEGTIKVGGLQPRVV